MYQNGNFMMYNNVHRTLDVTVHNDPVTSVAVQVLHKKRLYNIWTTM